MMSVRIEGCAYHTDMLQQRKESFAEMQFEQERSEQVARAIRDACAHRCMMVEKGEDAFFGDVCDESGTSIKFRY